MSGTTDNKVVLIKRATRLDGLVARYNTVSQARFVIESQGQDFADYQAEHDRYYRQLDVAREKISQSARVQELDRSFLPNFLFGPHDVVVALGQDGLVANTLKYLADQPLLGVNPDPGRWDGVLLPFQAVELDRVLPEYFAGQRKARRVTMAEATLNDGQKIRAVNDLFIGQRTHLSSRYSVEHKGQREHQSSSGIVVSTGMGSTGWYLSLMTGASIISSTVTGQASAKKPVYSFPWDADYLRFTVREPFPSRHSSTHLVFGKITRNEPLKLFSEAPENGVIFSDGVEQDAIAFNSGAQATINLSPVQGHLIV